MDPWHGEPGRNAFEKLLKLTVSHGTRDEQAIARDVLEGRLKETDILYMPDQSGKATAGLHELALQWENLPEEEQAKAMRNPEEAIRKITEDVENHTIDATEPDKGSTRRPDTDDDEDFSEINCVRR